MTGKEKAIKAAVDLLTSVCNGGTDIDELALRLVRDAEAAKDAETLIGALRGVINTCKELIEKLED